MATTPVSAIRMLSPSGDSSCDGSSHETEVARQQCALHPCSDRQLGLLDDLTIIRAINFSGPTVETMLLFESTGDCRAVLPGALVTGTDSVEAARLLLECRSRHRRDRAGACDFGPGPRGSASRHACLRSPRAAEAPQAEQRRRQ